jgi:hypothetical protein
MTSYKLYLCAEACNAMIKITVTESNVPQSCIYGIRVNVCSSAYLLLCVVDTVLLLAAMNFVRLHHTGDQTWHPVFCVVQSHSQQCRHTIEEIST